MDITHSNLRLNSTANAVCLTRSALTLGLRGLAVIALMGLAAPSADTNDALVKARGALEAVRRLKGADLEAKPALKNAILRLATQLQGQPELVELVRDFNLTNQYPALLEYAVNHPVEPAAGEGLRLVLHADPNSVRTAIEKTNQTLPLLTALGTTAHPDTVPIFLPWLTNPPDRSIPIRRAALRGLTRSQEGARAVLDLAAAGRLDEDLKPLAATELQAVRWATIKAEAAKVLPLLPRAANALPPVSELVQRSGDAMKGAMAFRRPDAACSTCHQVNGEGVDFGPKLSEIGAKLGKDALYDAIIEPSSGISFGYEAWLLSFRNGEEAFGIIASETEDEIAVKQSGGLIVKFKKADLLKREKQNQSLMPEGLANTLPLQDLIDLVEYLSSLKKATN